MSIPIKFLQIQVCDENTARSPDFYTNRNRRFNISHSLTVSMFPNHLEIDSLDNYNIIIESFDPIS